MSVSSNQDWDSEKSFRHVIKRSFAPHPKYANIDPQK